VGTIHAAEWNFVLQAISGDRTIVACRRWHSAIANFCTPGPKRIRP